MFIKMFAIVYLRGLKQMNTQNEQLKVILQALQERNQEIEANKKYKKVLGEMGIRNLFPYAYSIDTNERGFN